MIGKVYLASCRFLMFLQCQGTHRGRITDCKVVAYALLAFFYQIFHEMLFLGEATGLHPFAEAEGAFLWRGEQIGLRASLLEYVYLAKIKCYLVPFLGYL